MTHHTTESVERLATDLTHKVARIITLDHLQLLEDFDVDGDIYRQDPECSASAYVTANAILEVVLAAQSYTYIGKDGKPVLARDLEDERDALRARLDEAEKDVARIDLIQSEYLDVKCFPIPTGEGDADVGWIAVNHHEGTPSEKTVAEVFMDNCRAALDEARAFLNGGGNGGV
ncbi:hypothetical protein KUV62_15915 [Salipiger bermudensis]|uniref:hypothetical protein n=1 Tax=Salipiger bermudensis TaxID=344736 RepID=UPI001C99C803|nr:hypothetical protein [Salipiger bermudensis]MBY6005412.1 hypothetical protein [Salipiger bermudensis]